MKKIILALAIVTATFSTSAMAQYGIYGAPAQSGQNTYVYPYANGYGGTTSGYWRR